MIPRFWACHGAIDPICVSSSSCRFSWQLYLQPRRCLSGDPDKKQGNTTSIWQCKFEFRHVLFRPMNSQMTYRDQETRGGLCRQIENCWSMRNTKSCSKSNVKVCTYFRGDTICMYIHTSARNWGSMYVVISLITISIQRVMCTKNYAVICLTVGILPFQHISYVYSFACYQSSIRRNCRRP